MKIAIVISLAEQRGGGELTLMHLLRQGRELGIHWLVIFLENGPMVTETQSLGIPTQVVPAGRLRQPMNLIKTIATIAHILRAEKVNGVVSWMAKPHFYAGPAAFFTGISACWFQHGIPTPKNGMDRIATWIPASGIMTCSHVSRAAQDQLSPCRPSQTVHPGVEIERFDPEKLPAPTEMRQRLGLPRTGLLIGMVGRLQRWKGMHVLIQAMPKIQERYPDIRCVIVGGQHALEPDYPDYLTRLVTEMGLEDTIIRAGLQSNVQKWMQAMDVVVHASENEPFGMVIIEAMALGKPVVAASQGGPAEIITDGVNGILAPYGDSDRLAQAILQYLDDPDFARQVGIAARIRAADFSTQRYAQNVVAAVQKFCTPPGFTRKNERQKA